MMSRVTLLATTIAAGLGASLPACSATPPSGIDKIGHIVFIYLENRSFDSLYGYLGGVDGLHGLTPAQYRQKDRDQTTVLAKLPATWGGLSPAGYPVTLTEAQTANQPNRPFGIDAPLSQAGFATPESVTHRDLYHRFYENQMEIHGGANDLFAAWADAGGLTMGNYHGGLASNNTSDQQPMVSLARRFVLADNFFQSAFGGSYLNHQFLICSCTPALTPAQQTRARTATTGSDVVVPVSVIHQNPDGTGPVLDTSATSPASALSGPPSYVASTTLAPTDADGNYPTINTMQPPYPPSGNGYGAGGLSPAGVAQSPALPQVAVNPDATSTVPPQTATTIGDLLSAANVSWAWYAGALQYAIDNGVYNGAAGTDPQHNTVPNFQPHHNPFNYYAAYAPGTAARAAHLRDGGLSGAQFIADIDADALPAVTFYKPQGNLNEHGGYTDVTEGDQATYDIIVNHLMKSPAYRDMVIVVTYDEFGGFWDHVAPPKGDAFGPGTRIPAIIVSPFAKRGTVDHTQYDTTSILRLITNRYQLPVLSGITRRDSALMANGFPAMGDLTAALNLN